jgi:hypothetical protein
VTVRRQRVAVRAWAVPHTAARPAGSTPAAKPTQPDLGSATGEPDLGPSEWQLVFDCETQTDLGQALRFLTWQERHRHRLRSTGIAYNTTQLSSDEVELLHRIAAEEGLRLLTVDEFIHKVLFNIGWAKRGSVIGFNLPFDLSRLAIAHTTARSRGRHRSMQGGWSFQLSRNEWLPRTQIKRINGRGAFIRFTTPDGRHPEQRNRDHGGNAANYRGYFVDVATLGSALLGGRHRLADLANLLQTPTRKRRVEQHGGKLTRDYVRYALTDTQVTWECYTTLAARYAGYRLDTPLHKIYSEASIGKAPPAPDAAPPVARREPRRPPLAHRDHHGDLLRRPHRDRHPTRRDARRLHRHPGGVSDRVRPAAAVAFPHRRAHRVERRAACGDPRAAC